MACPALTLDDGRPGNTRDTQRSVLGHQAQTLDEEGISEQRAGSTRYTLSERRCARELQNFSTYIVHYDMLGRSIPKNGRRMLIADQLCSRAILLQSYPLPLCPPVTYNPIHPPESRSSSLDNTKEVLHQASARNLLASESRSANEPVRNSKRDNERQRETKRDKERQGETTCVQADSVEEK
jgi:hypothetical protein